MGVDKRAPPPRRGRSLVNPDAAEPGAEPEVKKLEFMEGAELPVGVGDDESEPEGEGGTFLVLSRKRSVQKLYTAPKIGCLWSSDTSEHEKDQNNYNL